MKKYKILAYIVLIAIIIIMGCVIYVNASKDPKQDQKEKTFSEIEYLESELTELFNVMNGISNNNYNVSVKEISKDTAENTQSQQSESNKNGESPNNEKGSSQSQEGSESSEGAGSSGNSEQSGGSSNSQSGQEENSKSSASQTQNEANQKYELELSGILTGQEQIDWENIKGEIEVLYSSIPNITLDLYEMNVNKDDILNFNKEYDNLIKVSQNENKQEFLDILNTLYGYIPGFFSNLTDDEDYKTVIEAKKYVLTAYSKLDQENWQEINTNISKAIEVYSKLVTNTNMDTGKQLAVNKGYIILNEMQNAVNINDRSVFLIKYKNLLEEFKNI